MDEQLSKQQKEEQEKERARKQQAKFAKEQAAKKKQIAEYKRKKLEAEEMLANADLDMDDYAENDNIYQPNKSKNSFKASMASDLVALGGTQNSYN